MDYWGSTAPNSSFAFAYGQAISRTTYAALFSIISTTYGSGDGSTTFNLPDCRGRVIAGVDNMGGSAASRLTSTYFGANASNLGAVGGNEKETIANGNLPANIPNTLGGSLSLNGGGNTYYLPTTPETNTNVAGGVGASLPVNSYGAVVFGGSVSITGAINGLGANTPLVTVQPTITANKILRII